MCCSSELWMTVNDLCLKTLTDSGLETECLCMFASYGGIIKGHISTSSVLC